MKKFLMKRYALSGKGANDFIKATLLVALSDLSLMLPVSIAFFLVKDLLEGGTVAHYWIYGGGILLSLCLMTFLHYFQYNAEFFSTYKESGRRRISLAETLRRLPLSYFGKRDAADLTKIVLSDATLLEHNFSHVMPQFYGSVISTFIVVVLLFAFDWRLALASVWVFPVAMIIVLTSRRVQTAFNKPKDAAAVECETGVQEYIETVKDFKANFAENRMLEPVKKSLKKMEKRAFAAEAGVAAFVVSAQMALKFGIATTALIGAYLLSINSIDVYVFFMYLIVVSRIYEPMNGTLINLAAIINQDLTVKRMNEIYDFPVQGGETDFVPENYDVCFNDVKFSYNDGETVLNGVSFTAKQGEITALIGPSGGGKSTAGKLSARFYDVSGGEITLGGKNVNEIEPETLLKNYSVVFQDVVLFNDTVKANIRIGRENATDEEVLCAAKAAKCDEFIKKLPQGYDTVIGENGNTLSGGERQRISIARALLKDAPIVLLDEATASLDAENETDIQQAISRLTENKTVIIIAHRMRTVENADKIVFIKNGKVKEEGKPSELIKNENSEFYKMVSVQKENFNLNLKN